MLVHYPLNLLRIITFPKHSKGLVSRKSRAISPPQVYMPYTKRIYKPNE